MSARYRAAALRRAFAVLCSALAVHAAALAQATAPEGEGDGDAVVAAAPDDAGEVLADRVVIDDGIAVASPDGRTLVLRVALEEHEPWDELARRLCGDAKLAPELAQANAGREPAGDATIEVPWALARAEYRYLALRMLFPGDGPSGEGWIHRPDRARVPLSAEGLWEVASWFTGRGENWTAIARANGLRSPRPGAAPVRIPRELLLPPFQPVTMGSGGLRYGSDATGAYAEYRLGRGEALYTAVVIRFTDLTQPGDVNAAAEVIRQRSGIADVRRMSVGQKVRIPLDLLSVPYLPDNEPRRVLARLHDAEIVALAPPARAIALDGVHVILDPGHGGQDVGALGGKVWESDYMFDVACRVQRKLAAESAAAVRLLVRDPRHGCRVFDRRKLPRRVAQVIDSKPPVPIRRGRTRAAVNGRWQLANDIFKGLGQEGVPADKVVFISLHADSLHKSLRGSMVYVPGERYRRSTGRGPARAAVPRAVSTVTRADRLRDEALSRRLAWALLEGYREQGLPVHADQPVRDHVVRGRGKKRGIWLPAVLRGTRIPTKVLLETLNLGNADDARLLEDPAGRERIATAIVAGLLRFYSAEKDAGPGRWAGGGANPHGSGAARPAGAPAVGAR